MRAPKKTDLRILLLEDSERDAELILRELKKEELTFVARRVQTRGELSRQLSEFRPGIILADYMLPNFNGAQALALATERCPDVPVIIISGAVGEETAVELLNHGATDFILKHHLDRLVPAVHRALQKVAERNIRRQAEVMRKQYSGKLQALSRRLVEVQETERRNIARELHDEIGQALTVIQLNLQGLLQAADIDALRPRLDESLKVVERMLEQVQDISLNLRPSILDDLGLEPALRWYTERQATLVGLHAEFHMDILKQRLDPMIETECFRVAQEALTNVVRHARAKAVTVELRHSGEQLHLRVRDDGVGFEVATTREKAQRGASLGLLSMAERAALTGGGLEFRSSLRKGTEVHAWFPLRWLTSSSKSKTS
ncbi:MAG: response regulator [Verrucomicrobiota bacterium]